jgi:hypothetical protein
MDSEVDSSLLAPLTVSDSASISSKRGKSAHATWAHTRTNRGDEPEFKNGARLLYCVYCPQESPYSNTVTTNFRKHLKSKHQINVDEDPSQLQSAILEKLQQAYNKADSLGHTYELDSQILRKVLNQDVINEALVSLIVVRNLSFRIVEWPEFHALCRVLNPESESYLATAHSTIPKLIKRSWQAQKDIVRKKLQSALSSIHISLDIWTSPNRLLLLGICAHFVGYGQEKVSKTLLALRTVINHSGDEQFATLLPVLQDYGVIQKLGSIICDNATSNDKLCRTMSIYLHEKEEIPWDFTTRRIRCIGHIINLAVQAFLFQSLVEIDQLELYDEQEAKGEIRDEVEERAIFRKIGPLGKLHNIVVHIQGSAGRTKEFKDLAKRTIPLDNRTRWNSWYQMLIVAIEKAGSIDTYTKNYLSTLEAEYLSLTDWDRLRTIKTFLQPFHRATLETQGDYATIDRVLFTMDILVQYFEKALVSIPYTNETLLILCDSLTTLLIKSFIFEFERGGRFLINTIVRQTTLHFMRLL